MLMLWNDRPRELWLGERQLKCTLTLPNAPSITPIRTLKPHQAMVARGTWPKAKYQQCHPSSPTRSALNIAAMGEQLMLIFGSFYLNVSLKVDGEELMSAVYVCVCVSVSVCSVCVGVCVCVFMSLWCSRSLDWQDQLHYSIGPRALRQTLPWSGSGLDPHPADGQICSSCYLGSHLWPLPPHLWPPVTAAGGDQSSLTSSPPPQESNQLERVRLVSVMESCQIRADAGSSLVRCHLGFSSSPPALLHPPPPFQSQQL